VPEPRIAIPAISPASIAARDAGAEIIAVAGTTMGTSWQVHVAARRGLDRAALETAIQSRLGGLVAEMSHWEADSLLSRFNRLPAGSWMALPPDFATVIAAGLNIALASNGAFDPTIGALVDAWGLGPLPATAPPGAAAIAAARAVSGWQKLEYDPAARRLRQPGGLRLDLSGIAKGYAVDAVADLLQAQGHGHCLVEVGGELAGRGVKPDAVPWWVDLEAPVAGLPPFRIALHELAVATSGTYVRGDHNIDPATGYPAAHDVVSASVLHPSAMHADAWASALTVLGPEAGMALAEREHLAVRIIVAGPDMPLFDPPPPAGGVSQRLTEGADTRPFPSASVPSDPLRGPPPPGGGGSKRGPRELISAALAALL